VLLGNGNGTFRAQTTFAAGGTPNSVAAADLNGDGKLDLVVASFPLSVLMGNGDGTFQPPVSYSTIGIPSIVTTGDVNGDGKLDLVVADGDTLSVLLGNGDGTFQPGVDYGGGGNWVTTGDFNGDGKLDLALTTGSGVSVWLGAGDGTFRFMRDYSTAGPSPVSSTKGDFNGDGNPDLAVLNYDPNAGAPPGTASVLLGNGDGTFRPHVDYATGAAPLSAAVGDFDGDGKLDLSILNYQDNTFLILLGNADGTLQPHVDYATAPLPRFIVVGDFNHDGKLDLAVAHGNLLFSYGISVMLGNGDGTFRQPTEYTTPSAPQSLVMADLNGESNLDLAALNYGEGDVSILLGNGDGTFQQHADYPTGNLSPEALTAGDFNGDGRLDLFIAGAYGCSILLGNGDGTFQAPIGSSQIGGFSVTTGDFNNDEKLDVATPTAVLLGNGGGTFQTEPGPYAGNSVQAVDVNRNGNTDVVGVNQVGFVSVFLNLPVVGVYPSRLSFAGQTVGTTSAVEEVTVSNPGIAPLKISSILASGDFAQTNTCPLSPATLAPGANCTVSVTFTPSSAGALTGAITVTDNAPGSPQKVFLTGNPPAVSFSPTTLTYAIQFVATTSSAQTVTLSNPGNNAINISEIEVGGPNASDFAESNNCGSVLVAGANCNISATFTPSARGSRTAVVTVFDDASNSPRR
jgi:VCBS repeat protein/ASPM-SPD-2-Hydin domain-containing protein